MLIFHRFLSGLAWIHNLYLKACGPPGPPRWPGGARLKAHYGRLAKGKGRLPVRQKQYPTAGGAVGGSIKERNYR